MNRTSNVPLAIIAGTLLPQTSQKIPRNALRFIQLRTALSLVGNLSLLKLGYSKIIQQMGCIASQAWRITPRRTLPSARLSKMDYRKIKESIMTAIGSSSLTNVTHRIQTRSASSDLTPTTKTLVIKRSFPLNIMLRQIANAQ